MFVGNSGLSIGLVFVKNKKLRFKAHLRILGVQILGLKASRHRQLPHPLARLQCNTFHNITSSFIFLWLIPLLSCCKTHETCFITL